MVQSGRTTSVDPELGIVPMGEVITLYSHESPPPLAVLEERDIHGQAPTSMRSLWKRAIGWLGTLIGR